MNNSQNTVLVTGNTYPVKDSIKGLGGRWDAAAKGWRVPAAKAAQAQALVAGAPKSAPRAAASSYRLNYRGAGSAAKVAGYSSYCTGRSGCGCYDCE